MKTIVRHFSVRDQALNALHALENSGFTQAEVSIIGHEDTFAEPDKNTDMNASSASSEFMGDENTTPLEAGPDNEASATTAASGATLGAIVFGEMGLLAGIGSLAIPGIGPLVAAGWLVSTITAAGIGALTGGILGALLGAGAEHEDAAESLNRLESGGVLVVVRTDDARATEAMAIIDSFHPIDESFQSVPALVPIDT